MAVADLELFENGTETENKVNVPIAIRKLCLKVGGLTRSICTFRAEIVSVYCSKSCRRQDLQSSGHLQDHRPRHDRCDLAFSARAVIARTEIEQLGKVRSAEIRHLIGIWLVRFLLDVFVRRASGHHRMPRHMFEVTVIGSSREDA